MAMSQMALIQSLGEAMAWFEREVSWGVPTTELRHLRGRIGELFVAVITNGRMATEINQKGYDVVSSANERISVKTTATMGTDRQIAFAISTLSVVDRIIILRVNTEEREIETLLDAPIDQAMAYMGPETGGKRLIALSKLAARPSSLRKARTVSEVRHGIHTVRELENGTIEVETNGEPVTPVKPVLRELAAELNVGLLNASGNPHNTRQPGALIVKNIQALQASI
jgi:hypothetical protein